MGGAKPALLGASMDFPSELKRQVARVERGIDLHVPPADTPPARLHTAMRYSLEAGGKRLRPVLVLAAAELFGVPPEDDRALPAAVAIECVHTYSLIHDDLPCMDNDDLRRGRPTAHKAFDEATALLAGDALLTEAFVILSTHYPADTGVALIRELSTAASGQNLIGGQMLDLLAEKRNDVSAEELRTIHCGKTAAMIEAALAMGGLIGGVRDAEKLNPLHRLGRHVGLCFQIVDDILDATADSAALGKTAGKDAKANKTTFVKLHGLDGSRRFAREQTEAALKALGELPGDTAFLAALIDAMAARSR
jgi:geranylgeranyl diphosphate synthase, type II